MHLILVLFSQHFNFEQMAQNAHSKPKKIKKRKYGYDSYYIYDNQPRTPSSILIAKKWWHLVEMARYSADMINSFHALKGKPPRIKTPGLLDFKIHTHCFRVNGFHLKTKSSTT